jgi:hypothetical protein
VRQPKLPHRKTPTPIVAKQPRKDKYDPVPELEGICAFTKFKKILVRQKEHKYPLGNHTCFSLFRVVWQTHYSTKFMVCQYIKLNFKPRGIHLSRKAILQFRFFS